MKVFVPHRIKLFLLVLYFSRIVFPMEVKATCIASFAPGDTTGMSYYSFNEHREVLYKEYLSRADSPSISICEKGDVYLEAPDMGPKASYVWKGPNGYTGLGRELFLQNLLPEQSGYYTAYVSKEGKEIQARIKVKVHSLPVVEISKTEFRPSEKIIIETEITEPQTRYSWKDLKGRELSRLSSLELAPMISGQAVYNFYAERNGCVVKHPVEITILDYESAPKKTVTEMLRSVK